MIRIGTPDDVKRSRDFDEPSFKAHVDYIIDSQASDNPGPQAFVVNQAPDTLIPVHFHREEQFQVTIGGGGKLGRHALDGLCVHYASREAGYGPLVAGDQGLKYLTLRCMTNFFIGYLPEARPEMTPGLSKRQSTVGPVQTLNEQVSSLAAAQVATVLVPDDAGLAGWLISLPPGMTGVAPDASPGAGRFHVVVSGTAECQEQTLAQTSCVFTSHDEPPIPFTGGKEGGEVLVLQFPQSALRSETLLTAPVS